MYLYVYIRNVYVCIMYSLMKIEWSFFFKYGNKEYDCVFFVIFFYFIFLGFYGIYIYIVVLLC